ncbi:MAG: NAD(P)H-dependent glycerol-3-phosphate dehydrogenase [Bacilli bacterium]
MKVCVIGSGSWGSALASVLADNKHDVIVYGHNKEEINDLKQGYNHKFFKDVALNKNIKATTNLRKALQDALVIVMVVPTSAMSLVLKEINHIINEKPYPRYFINASKGFDPITNDVMSNTIRKEISANNRYEICSIIGPSHAEEVVLKYYTAIASVSIDQEVAQFVQELFSNDYLRLYTMNDEIGAEYGVAIKNVLALCSGIIQGIGLGDNTRAALLTRGLNEMIRYGVAKGGKMESFLGLTGVGDLIVTATSIHSRNFQAGYQIGQSGHSQDVINNDKTTVEGIRSAKVIYQDAKANNIDMPIVSMCYKVLYENLEPKKAIDELMARKLKPELGGQYE